MFGRRTDEEIAQETHDKAIETAWRIHGALSDWTGKVDAKASFAFTLESAGVATAIALADDKRVYDALEGPVQEILYFGGLVALSIAAAFSVWVVIPRLRFFKVKKEWPSNFIYFGHLKYWDYEMLPGAIMEKDLLPVLTHQLVKMSKICWRKHVAVVISMILAVLGGAALVGCAFMVQFGSTP
ncbi:Pycsar system effector family protein [Arthrobacter sp. JZ12]|uniref:Pycsar system effector family protein n=1 Tax=Arthrobacter sp. JZ12 TaxID=2654190 RepID=UPI002B476EE1|nr:Pycsar system effector family protein [Arthrobacter sp. JZ12]